MNKIFISASRVFVISFSLFLLSACATTGNLDERDPWEGFNRGAYSFNQTMDEYVFNPIGEAYNFITPQFVDDSVSNFFRNIAQIPVIANDILQLKFDQTVNDSVRFLINSTIGLFGFLDVSGSAGLHSSREDFGQTLAHWGMGPGPYLVMPLLGPATVRDGVGFAIDSSLLSPLAYIDDDPTRAGLLALQYVDVKSDLLGATDLIGEAAVDEYEFTKNAYFARRESQINDSDSAFEEFLEE